MLQTGGFFGQQQKNIKAPFKGLVGSFQEVNEREVKGKGGRSGLSYQQFAQPKMYKA